MSKRENYEAKRDILGGSSQLGYVVNNHSNHSDRKSPKDRVVGPLPNCLGGIQTTYIHWDDPPSSQSQVREDDELPFFLFGEIFGFVSLRAKVR